jgi:hypothetical protein
VSTIEFVKLTRGMCFGHCPVYHVTLRSDGTASWHGEAFVERMGTYEGRFNASEFAHLAALVERCGFFDWHDEYTEMVTDLPTYTLTVSRAQQSKTVLQYATDEPADFWMLAALVDGVSMQVVWEDSKREGPDFM